MGGWWSAPGAEWEEEGEEGGGSVEGEGRRSGFVAYWMKSSPPTPRPGFSWPMVVGRESW
jgi:hypothetical protein